ncbi:Metallo-dependent phosphatase-like protein [Trichoderma austrokoningii]
MDSSCEQSNCGINTRLLILSDTHGMQFPSGINVPHADVAIHCGDLTQHSKLDEFRAGIRQMEMIDAPLKLIIAGNHDFALDLPTFRQKISEASRLETLDDALVKKEYGDYGAAQEIMNEAKNKGIIFLNEGSHRFSLQNGALLKVYASPYTPSTVSSNEWGFQYSGSHSFSIDSEIDITITHGPPHGIMDMSTERKRIGCPQLFAAVAKAQPRIHCFGHVHEGWGAKLVTWRSQISSNPSHFTDIDNDRSTNIETLLSMRGSKFESPEDKKTREKKVANYSSRGYCQISSSTDNALFLGDGKTLFINAVIQGHGDLNQLPWVVDIQLPAHVS